MEVVKTSKGRCRVLRSDGVFFRPLMTGLSYLIWPRHHHPVFRFSSSSQSIPRKQRRMWAPDPERRATPQSSPETPLGAVCWGNLYSLICLPCSF
jgi:hypothetical protein